MCVLRLCGAPAEKALFITAMRYDVPVGVVRAAVASEAIVEVSR